MKRKNILDRGGVKVALDLIWKICINYIPME